MLHSFTNISTNILLHILGHRFCGKHLIFGAFLPNTVAIKGSKIICAKKLLCFGDKYDDPQLDDS